jgi:hypothetical protein
MNAIETYTFEWMGEPTRRTKVIFLYFKKNIIFFAKERKKNLVQPY